jgi:hypothetical protein
MPALVTTSAENKSQKHLAVLRADVDKFNPYPLSGNLITNPAFGFDQAKVLGGSKANGEFSTHRQGFGNGKKESSTTQIRGLFPEGPVTHGEFHRKIHVSAWIPPRIFAVQNSTPSAERTERRYQKV